MVPEGSVPSLQEPAIGPYPESDESTPSHPVFSFIFNIILLSRFVVCCHFSSVVGYVT